MLPIPTLLLALLLCAGVRAPRADALRVVMVTDGASVELLRGVRFGAAEMAHTAKLLRRELTHVELPGAALDTLQPSAGATFVITVDSAAAIVAHGLGHAVLDVRRGTTTCTTYRLGESAAQREGAGAGETIELWHGSLFRFGATQLNERYLRAHGTPMTSASWMGWMAVKIAWESAMRTDGSAAATTRYMASTDAHFDGHKGRALRFDDATRWLVQPLYVVHGDSVIREIAADAALAEAGC